MFRFVVLLVALCAGVAAQNPDFGKYKDCWSCTGDGWGWCPIARKCGGFANRECGDKSDERYYREDSAPKPHTECTVLTDANFDDVVDGSKFALVEFFAPWCGHCKNLKPDYEKVCKDFKGEADVVIATVDATQHAATAQRFLVQGYPTIKFFSKGNDDPEEYNGGRSESDFVDFINSKAGTLVQAGGGLKPEAGRDDVLDGMVSAFYHAGAGATDKVIADAADHKSEKGMGEYYVNVMRKVASKGHEHVTKQLERLEKMVQGDSLTPAKANEFRKKLNVLRVFDAASKHAPHGEL